ncbi:MAG TPA: hypothetical protein VLA56_21530 [Pseudomonadales bacterium]|nr:hypothetical protein [Pseudomonadales bacterium]
MNRPHRAAVAALALLCTLGVPAHAEQEGTPFSAYFSFSTDKPAAVVAALQAFAASDCRKAMPTAMRLMGNLFNGDEPATHTLIWSNASIEDMQEGFGAFGACRESAVLGATMAELTEPVSQVLGMPLIAEGDPATTSVYTLWQVTLTDEAAYVKAYEKLMAKLAEDGMGPTAWGLIRIVGGRDSEVTHLVYSGSPTLVDHFSGAGDSRAYADFAKSVDRIRTIRRQSVNFAVADL